MKKITILLIMLTLSTSVFQLNAQTDHKELTPNDKNYTGLISKNDFESGYTESWFTKAYNSYEPTDKTAKKIGRKIDKYTIKVFMGTWCPDSRREVPKLFKLLDIAEYDLDNLSVYAMNRRKSTDKNYEEGLNVHRVPTIIFFDKKGNEVNRFVEFPQENFEEDILQIVSKKEYANPYAEE
ncbi:TlpA family protein disulfide reductase [Mesonia aquimarina]|uniref:TlpA family protein disulfide reductase n=1 Tax=Mesonia aquimarina TaxID=1504967 RepID=UPI000EF61E1C|nr:thioredoxin family protein [Mesonia aquimarina]